MRYIFRALLAGGMGFAAAVLVACGGANGLLSSHQAGSLNNQLDQVAAAIGAGRCSNAVNAAASFTQFVNGLPVTVNQTLSNNLKQGAATIGRLTIRDCGRQAPTTTPTTSTKTNTTPTTSTKTNTTPTTSTQTNTSTSGTGTTPPPTTSTATTGTGSGTTSTGGSGGAGLGGNTSTGSGGAGTGNGNGQ